MPNNTFVFCAKENFEKVSLNIFTRCLVAYFSLSSVDLVTMSLILQDILYGKKLRKKGLDTQIQKLRTLCTAHTLRPIFIYLL